MLYLDNIIFSLQKHGGVSVLWGNLIQYLLNHKVDTKFLDYKCSQSNKIRHSILIPEQNLILNESTPIFLERYRDVRIKDERQIIFHSSHYRICNQHNVKNITTVHDFTYEYFVKGIAKGVHIWQKYKAIKKSDIIICISKNTKADLMRFLPEIPEQKIRVIYNGVSDDYYPIINDSNAQYNDYILFVGGRQSYKNFEFAISCVRHCQKKLLIVGSLLTDKERKTVIECLGSEGYKEIVHPSNNLLNQIYNSVFCLLYPSLYEGFGIPVIEAQKAGCPVIALNSSSIPEIIGNHSLLLNHSSCSEFKNKMEILSKNRVEFISAGLENSKRFSWDKMTSEYANIYNEM